MKVLCELHAGYLNYGYDPFTARSMRASVRTELKLAELRSECIELLANVCTVNLSARPCGCLCVRVAFFVTRTLCVQQCARDCVFFVPYVHTDYCNPLTCARDSSQKCLPPRQQCLITPKT
jgi:hypothetical protein